MSRVDEIRERRRTGYLNARQRDVNVAMGQVNEDIDYLLSLVKDGGAENVIRELFRDAGAVVCVNEPGELARVEIRFSQLKDAQRLHKAIVEPRATASTETSERCGECGKRKSESVKWHEAIPTGEQFTHPEDYCRQCGRSNVVWFAPSPLWNKAVREHGLSEMLCPQCFIEAAERAGIKTTAWEVAPEGWHEEETQKSILSAMEIINAAIDNAPAPSVAQPEADPVDDTMLRGSVEVTVFRGAQVLAVNSRNFDGFCGVGGKVEPGETFEQAAWRELMEETGCEVRTVQFVAGHTLDPIKGDDATVKWYCAGFVVDIGDQEPRPTEPGTVPFWTTKENMVQNSLFPEWYSWWFEVLDRFGFVESTTSPSTAAQEAAKEVLRALWYVHELNTEPTPQREREIATIISKHCCGGGEAERRPRLNHHANMDWQQVALNGGPPCFAILSSNPDWYCGRAQRWQGHGSDKDHQFVPLEALAAKATLYRWQEEMLTSAEKECAELRAEVSRLSSEVDAFWLALERSWEIEPRSYFEKEAPKKGFESPLAMAVHYMWKRDTKTVQARAYAIGACIEAAQSVSTTNSAEEFSTGRCASEVKASIVAVLEQLKDPNAKEKEENRDSKATRS